jgi:hypothetical protein
VSVIGTVKVLTFLYTTIIMHFNPLKNEL